MADGDAPQAILLDALGTLVALEDPAPRLVSLLAARHGIEVTVDDARRALRAEIAHYRHACVRAADAASLHALRLECAALLAAELGPAAGAVAVEQLARTLLDSLQFTPFADARAALGRLRARGIRLVVASNWDISLHDVLAECGLRALLDGAISSAEVGRAKPDPRPLLAALELAGAAPAATWHVGDSVSEDVGAAQAAGITPVLLVRGGAASAAPPGVRVVRSLAELP